MLLSITADWNVSCTNCLSVRGYRPSLSQSHQHRTQLMSSPTENGNSVSMTKSSSPGYDGVLPLFPLQPSVSVGGAGVKFCALLEHGRACNRPPGNASYSKKIQGMVAQRRLRLELDPKADHMYICEHHKTLIQTVRAKRKRRESEESSETVFSQTSSREYIDLFQLQMNTLRRYKKHFKLTSRPGLNKAQLAEFLTRHLKTIPVTEKEALTYFIYMIKTNKSRRDNSELEQDHQSDP